jgi:hypothetical protein
MGYKRNQIEDAICQTFGAEGPRARELKLRIKRLLVTDRRLAHWNGAGRRFAFYSEEASGSGIEVMFTEYEAFAVLAGLLLLEHGIPQATVVNILRQLRSDLEVAYRETLKKDPRVLFDQKALQAMAKPGMIATDNTEPVFLVLTKLPESTVDRIHDVIAVCRGPDEMGAFLKKYSGPGLGSTVFELVSLMHRFAANLSKTHPIKRGRSTI